MSSRAPTPEAPALAWAEEAHALVPVHPRRALELALRARAAAVAAGDPRAELSALYSTAYAQLTLGDAGAEATMRAGIRMGERHGDRRGVGLLRRLLAVALTFAGKTRAGQREIDAALALLSGLERARSEVHRVAVYRGSPSLDAQAYRKVFDDSSRALRLLRQSRDELWEARLLYNRGLLLENRGELARAEAELLGASALYARVGAEMHAVDARVALAGITLLRGDVLACLRALDGIERTLPATGHIHYGLPRARAAALAQARLLPEARAAFEAYIALCARTGRRDYVAGSFLDLAAIAAMSDDVASALRMAGKAVRSFAAQGRPVNAALARSARLRADLLQERPSRSGVRSGLAAAAALEAAGWRRDALRTRLLLSRVMLASGSPAGARRQLELARPLQRHGTVADRVELNHARALMRLAEGDRAGAERLLAGGLTRLEDYRAALGAIELRAAASGIGAALASEGLRIAREAGEPARILLWSERLRANALRLPPVRPPRDRELGSLQAELRQSSARLREAEETGTALPGVARQQAELEAAIRARTRLLPGKDGASPAIPGRGEAAGALRARALVEYVALDGSLGALTLADGRLRFHELGPDASRAELDWLHFALTRLARGRIDEAQRAAASTGAAAAAAALERMLVEPLLPELGGAPLVVVPTGPLHALPWGALGSLAGRALVVAPSLSLWFELERRPRGRRRAVAIVAGPRLRHAAAEVRGLAALYPDATVVHGREATAERVLAALDGASLAHLACHGSFRADSPLFSALELADGPLNVYELQRLKRAPEVVVLSACDLAVSRLHPGDELLGLAAALLGMGTRTIVASVVPVPDAAARRLMLAFHRNLATGESPAAALARAQVGTAVPGFVCLGTG